MNVLKVRGLNPDLAYRPVMILDFGFWIGFQSQIANLKSKIKLADRAGLEPATSALTERHSDQLSYPSIKLFLNNPKSKIQNPKLDLVGKRGLLRLLSADKRQVCLLQTKGMIFQHSFVLANGMSAFVFGRILFCDLRLFENSGQKDLNLQSCGNLPLISLIRRLFYR